MMQNTQIDIMTLASNVQKPLPDQDRQFLTVYSNPQKLVLEPCQEALINLCIMFDLPPYFYGVIKPIEFGLLPHGLYFQDTIVTSRHHTTLKIVNYSIDTLVLEPYTAIGRFSLIR